MALICWATARAASPLASKGAEVGVETEGRAADELPELAQLGHALLSRIAGDDRGIDPAD